MFLGRRHSDRNREEREGRGAQEQQQYSSGAMAMVSSEDFSTRLVRPKDAAISCSHFWAHALIVSGLACFIVGAIVFSGE